MDYSARLHTEVHVVGTATSETQAIEWLQDHKKGWSLAILDLLLTEGSGFGLGHRFRTESPEGRVVILSEYATPGVRDRCKQLGADDAFLKSDFDSFVQYLETVANPAG
jgi:two-component system OmpR family response regulator